MSDKMMREPLFPAMGTVAEMVASELRRRLYESAEFSAELARMIFPQEGENL